MNNCKNIIFDLGNVILNIDYNATIKAFEALGISNFKELYSKAVQSSLFDDIETGKINEEQFVAEIQKISLKPLSYTQIIDAWNAIILDFPIRRLQILQQLQLHYNLVLLSNTNEIHEKKYNQILHQTCGFPSLAVFFDKMYLSHRVGMRKPNADIFELILNETKWKPTETLFIDDSLQHIQTAQKLGLQTIHMQDHMCMENDIFKTKN